MEFSTRRKSFCVHYWCWCNRGACGFLLLLKLSWYYLCVWRFHDMSHERSVALIAMSFMIRVCFLVSVLLPDRFFEWCLHCDMRRHSVWLLNAINLCSLPLFFPQLVFVSSVVMYINLSLLLFLCPLWVPSALSLVYCWLPCLLEVMQISGLPFAWAHMLAGLAFWLSLCHSSTLLARCCEVFLLSRCYQCTVHHLQSFPPYCFFRQNPHIQHFSVFLRGFLQMEMNAA